jgi:tripartite-type tricarboxylate transporter receptor subunit TctC
MRRVLRSAVSCCVLAHGAMGLHSGIAAAQGWPAKPVRVIAPFAAGGTADTLGRIVSGKLGESLGQSFIVENRAGAGGLVGSEVVSRSAPDGYMLGVSGVASHVVAPLLSKAPFDPLKDFTHIALFGGPPIVLALHPSLPAPDLKAFISLAKARPAELTYGSPGNGTHGHLIAELLKRTAGIDMRHVPYKGASIAVVDVTAGHIHALSTTLSTAAPQIRARRLRALAASSTERLPDFPQLPTFKELGYSQLVATVWFGLSGPPGLPPEIVTRLAAEVQRALQVSDTRERMRNEGVEPNPMDAPAFRAFIAAEIERWGPVVRTSGARAD